MTQPASGLHNSPHPKPLPGEGVAKGSYTFSLRETTPGMEEVGRRRRLKPKAGMRG